MSFRSGAKKAKNTDPLLYGFRVLARRDYSVAELERKMLSQGMSQDAVALALKQLIDERWLDDFRYGENLCRNLIERGYGPRYIRQVWHEKGIDEDQCFQTQSFVLQYQAKPVGNFMDQDSDYDALLALNGERSINERDFSHQTHAEAQPGIINDMRVNSTSEGGAHGPPQGFISPLAMPMRLVNATEKTDSPVRLSSVLEAFDDAFWVVCACKVLRDFCRKRWQEVPTDSPKIYRRASQLLQRRGFPADCACRALEKVFGNSSVYA